MSHGELERSCLRIACQVVILGICMGLFPRDGHGEEDAKGKLNAVLSEVVPANFPIVMKLIVANTGNVPLHYWSGGPGTYPDAARFTAKITNENGVQSTVDLINGQYAMGSGGDHQIELRQETEIPALIKPLLAGVYMIKFHCEEDATVDKEKRKVVYWPAMSSEEMKLTVKDDAELARKAEQAILQRVRKGEVFAMEIAATCTSRALIDDLLGDLSSVDAEVAKQAAYTLWKYQVLPKEAGLSIKKGLEKQLELLAQRNRDRQTRGWAIDGSFDYYLPQLAGRIGSDELLEVIISMARGPARGEAIRALAWFQQKQATEELKQLLEKDQSEGVQWDAACSLVGRGDEAAINALVRISRNPKASRQTDAFRVLAQHPENSEAVKAIKEGMQDGDERVRQSAKRASEAMERMKTRGYP